MSSVLRFFQTAFFWVLNGAGAVSLLKIDRDIAEVWERLCNWVSLLPALNDITFGPWLPDHRLELIGYVLLAPFIEIFRLYTTRYYAIIAILSVLYFLVLYAARERERGKTWQQKLHTSGFIMSFSMILHMALLGGILSGIYLHVRDVSAEFAIADWLILVFGMIYSIPAAAILSILVAGFFESRGMSPEEREFISKERKLRRKLKELTIAHQARMANYRRQLGD